MLVQKLRLQRGWSQQQLADLSGISVRTIQRLERGQPASTETLKSLAAVFETEFSTLQAEPDMTVSEPDSSSRARAEEMLAMQHVYRLKRFYMHLGTYVVVISLLVIINLVTSPHRMWAQWPALGWGVGIFFSGVSLFGWLPFFGADWEKRQVEKRLGRPL
jgi:transcriptional regulator with XRE-family HTH domain